MLQALAIAEVEAIVAASQARTRDERAMVEYIGIGRRHAKRPIEIEAPPRLVLPVAADLGAFDTDERRRLQHLLGLLSVEARRELIALVWLGQSLSLGFDAAMRRARRIPPEAQVGYLMSRHLERHVPAGLEKLTAARKRNP